MKYILAIIAVYALYVIIRWKYADWINEMIVNWRKDR